MEDTIGIDISKDTLDAYWLSSREHRQFRNDKAGAKALAFWARKTEVSRVIFEATGIYHRCIETGLAQHGISFARVNRRQVRQFCEGERFGRHQFKTNRERPAGQNGPGGRCAISQNGRTSGIESRPTQKRNTS